MAGGHDNRSIDLSINAEEIEAGCSSSGALYRVIYAMLTSAIAYRTRCSRLWGFALDTADRSNV